MNAADSGGADDAAPSEHRDDHSDARRDERLDPLLDELAREFEQGTLPPARLSHRLHLALGWRALQRDGFPAGAAAFCEQLRRYVDAIGATGKYHETITWAYLVLMNEERVLCAAPGESFDAMIERRPDLLDHRDGPPIWASPSAFGRRYDRRNRGDVRGPRSVPPLRGARR